MRKLVTVRQITAIEPIVGADRIEEVWVDGWSVVCQKGIHHLGDLVLYFELDSFLPELDPRFESFMKFGTRTFDGVVGHRVKTVRLKGTYSQGIIMPIQEFPEIGDNPEFDVDYSSVIGVVKWELPEVSGYSGDQKGTFPWFLQKSDQERIQNLYGKLASSKLSDELFVGTLKMDGSSITVFYVNAEKYSTQGFGICSRNQELKYDPELPFEEQGNFVKGAINSNLFNKVKELHETYGGYYAIQGELVGAGIQGGFEKFDTYQVFAYNIFDIEERKFVDYGIFEMMADVVELQTVPLVYEREYILKEPLLDILQMSNVRGLKAEYAEGIVWKQLYGDCQFKVISNKYLEKQK